MGEVVQLSGLNRMSGLELRHGFSREWGKFIFSKGDRSHFFVRTPWGYDSLCGLEYPAFIWTGQCSIFGPGNYPRCKRCAQIEASGLDTTP